MAGADPSTEGATGDVVRVICGPTGGGKTQLAMALAEALGAGVRLRVVSADSRQVYAGFAIGTAAPTAEEQRRVPHELVGTVAPTARFTASDWSHAARAAIDAARAAGQTPLVVGGTGFYLRALETPLFDEPPMDEARRGRLRTWLRTQSHEVVARWARALDPHGTHPGRAQRERAVELALLTGRARESWHRGGVVAPPPLRLRTLVIDPGQMLAPRLETRLDAMLAAGWLDEVRARMADTPADAPAWTACGYLALRDVVTGQQTLAAARDAVRIATRQYVKRQRTWFRHQVRDSAVTRLDPTRPDAVQQALAWWDAPSGDSTETS